MEDVKKKSKSGNIWIIIGGLVTTLSLTIIGNSDFKIVSSAIGFIFIVYGIVLTQQKENAED